MRSYTDHQGHLSERGLDDGRHDRHHHRRQLLRRAAGRVRDDARLERGESQRTLLSLFVWILLRLNECRSFLTHVTARLKRNRSRETSQSCLVLNFLREAVACQTFTSKRVNYIIHSPVE